MPDVQTASDLNVIADLMATLYDEVALLTSEALDLAHVAAGGDPLPLTYTPAGDEGPTSECPAIDGIAWSTVNDFTLSGTASHVGFLRGGVVQLTEPLPNLVGPGPIPYVHGIGPSARND